MNNAYHKQEDNKLKYTRVECWKCKMVHNWEKTKICSQCGCALRFYKKEEIMSLKGDSFLDSSAARSFLMIVFIFILFAGGYYYSNRATTPVTLRLTSHTAM